jgi:hypothetical protein
MLRPSLVLALCLASRLALAEVPAPLPAPAGDELPAFDFGVALYDVYLHRQVWVPYVFNDQSSPQITWRLRRTVGLVFGFQLPTRDETLREGDVEVGHYHFPKSLSAGVLWNVSRIPITPRGWLELAVGGGAEVGLSESPLQNLLPFAEINTRLAMTSGSAMQVAFKYAGVLSRGQFAIVVGVAQRI